MTEPLVPEDLDEREAERRARQEYVKRVTQSSAASAKNRRRSGPARSFP
jgi:hypothetical protein